MSNRTLHRSLAGLAGAGAAASLALIPAAGAHAAVHADYVAAGSSDVDTVGSAGNTCDLTSGPGSDTVTSSPALFGHGTKRRSADLKATYTDSLNTADKVTVKGHIESSMTIKKKHNDLSSFDIVADGSLKVTHTVAGSLCQGSGLMAAGVNEMRFTEKKKGWFSVTRNVKAPSSIAIYVLVNLDKGNAITLEEYQGGQSHFTNRALLKPGHYALEETQLGITIGDAGIFAKNAPLSAKIKKTLELQGQFKPLKK
jgi:hypothetical protein